MRLRKRDLIATALVAVAAILYLLWALDRAAPGMSSVRVSGIVILALGFGASAAAVVPGFEALLHGNKPYLVATSLIGLVAFIGGVLVLAAASAAGLAAVMAAMGILWLIATVHHTMLARAATTAPRTGRPATHAGR